MQFDDFLKENLLHYEPAGTASNGMPYDHFWWREVKEPNEGYIIIWENGEHHHTYRYPPDLH